MITLRPYQVEGVQRAMSQNIYLAYDCGLGKTVTGITIGQQYLNAGNAFPHLGGVLIITRKRLRLQWVQAIQDQVPDANPLVLETGIPFIPTDPALAGWNVTHFESLTRQSKLFSDRLWSVVIVDEAHNFNNRRSQRGKALRKLMAYRKVALSATPYDKDPSGIWNLLSWMHPHEFPNYYEFRDEFCETGMISHYITQTNTPVIRVKGVKDAALFAAILRPKMQKVTKKQAAPDLPELVFNRVPIQMGESQRELYDKIKKADDIVIDLEGDEELIVPNAIARLIRLQQVTSSPAANGIGNLLGEKIGWLSDYMTDNPEERILILTRFVSTAVRIGSILDCETIAGGAGPDRPELFLSRKNKYLVATIESVEGMDGLQSADTAIFIDQHWSTTPMTHAISRIHRLGIKDPKQIIYLRCPGTVDDLVLEALDGKWSEQQLVANYLEIMND